MVDTMISNPVRELSGELKIPGDKSISHRALMLASLANGNTEIQGFLPGEDCLSTLNAMRQLGVTIHHDQTQVAVEGVGLHGLQATNSVIDLGNSGTSIRLLSGILAGQPFLTRVTGDESLVRRPMQRIITPLTTMGAKIDSHDGKPPLTITGKLPLSGIDYEMPIASAQVKSCILLAGLFANARVRVTEPHASRDHTERMLATFGVAVSKENNVMELDPGQNLQANKIEIPADISSAAFFLVAASIAPKSDLLLKNIGMNPTRFGIIYLLKMMGANLEIQNERQLGAEPVADLRVKSAKLKGIDVPIEWVSNAIDEFPAFMVAASVATGVTRIRGAEELRVKESDRLTAMLNGLQTLGIKAESLPDGANIEGGTLQSGTIESLGDHRIAMAFAIAAARAQGPITIRNCQNVATSFPQFIATANACGYSIEGY